MPVAQQFDPATIASALEPINTAIEALWAIPAANTSARATQAAAIEALRQTFIAAYGAQTYWLATGLIYRPRDPTAEMD